MHWELVAAAALVNHKSKQRCCGMAVVWVRAALRWPELLRHSYQSQLVMSAGHIHSLSGTSAHQSYGSLVWSPLSRVYSTLKPNAAFTTCVGSGCHWNGLYSRWGDPFLFTAMLVNVMRMNVEEPTVFFFKNKWHFLCLWCNNPLYKGHLKENQDPTNRDTTYLFLKPCL